MNDPFTDLCEAVRAISPMVATRALNGLYKENIINSNDVVACNHAITALRAMVQKRDAKGIEQITMTKQENAMMADILQNLGALALAFGATLAVVNQEVPDFRERVLKSLDKAIGTRPDLAHSPNGAAIMTSAKALIAGLAKT